MGKKMKYIKLDADDIMEIVLHYYQEKFNHSECARGIILGTPEKDLRLIGVFGDLDNKNIENIDLKEIDQNMDYNGDHSWLRRNPDFYIEQPCRCDGNIDFDIVKKHIDEWDPIDLLTCCPNDEYDGESQMIVDSFRKENDLGKLIYNIFRESFGESTFHKSLKECNQVAQKIIRSTYEKTDSAIYMNQQK